MPKPKDGETEKDFVDRCIPIVIREGTAKDGEQGAAVCHSIWTESKKQESAAKMKVANIYITGQIGTSYNPDGSVIEKGVELQDVIAQVEKNKDAEQKNFIITSEGGSVQTGKAIAKYISSLENAFTIANKFCASIATEIHLAVALANRSIVAGTEYFLHAPLMNNVKGNADELIQMAEYVKDTEKEMLSMYIKATGMDKAALEGLMKQETSLTPEQTIELHFASKIIPSIEGKVIEVKNKNIVAFFDKKPQSQSQSQTQNEMANLAKKLDALVALVTEKLGLKVEAKEETLKDGKKIKIEMAGDMMTIGDVVSDETGKPTPNQSHTMMDGTVIKTDADSKISEINKPNPAASATDETAEVKALKAELETVKAERDAIKTAVASIEARMEKLGKSITSSGNPPADGGTQFRQRTVLTDKEKDLAAWKQKKEKELSDKNSEIKKKIGLQ